MHLHHDPAPGGELDPGSRPEAACAEPRRPGGDPPGVVEDPARAAARPASDTGTAEAGPSRAPGATVECCGPGHGGLRDPVEDHVMDDGGVAGDDPRRGDEGIPRQLRVEEEAAVIVGRALRRGRVGRTSASPARGATRRAVAPSAARAAARPACHAVRLPAGRAARAPSRRASCAPGRRACGPPRPHTAGRQPRAATAACGAPRAPRRRGPRGSRGRAPSGTRTARCRRPGGSRGTSRGRSERRRARNREPRSSRPVPARRRAQAREARRRVPPRAQPTPPSRVPRGSSYGVVRPPQTAQRPAELADRGARGERAAERGQQVLVRLRDAHHLGHRLLDRGGVSLRAE